MSGSARRRRRAPPVDVPAAAAAQTEMLVAATALLALAMHDSQGPVDMLGGALQRMMAVLARMGRIPQPGAGVPGSAHSAGPGTSDLTECRALLEREIAVCVEGLQFHDRLMQQLTYVRNCLAEVLHDPAVRSDAASDASWLHLKTQLRTRLGSDSQRALLDLLLPTDTACSGMERPRFNASEGSIELF